MKLLVTIDSGLRRIELVIAIAAMTGLVGLLVAQVFFRYLLLSPIFFAEELALILMVVATFAGLSLLVAENRLVAIDLFGGMRNAVVKQWIHTSIRSVMLVVCGLLAWFAASYVTTPWVWIERSATLNMPRAAIYLVVTAELFALCFHQFVQLVTMQPGKAKAVDST